MAARKKASGSVAHAIPPAVVHAGTSTLAEVLVARSNQDAVKELARRVEARPFGNPFCRRIVLVDSRAVGTSLLAELAATAGLAVGIEPTPVEEFISTLTATVERSMSPAAPPSALPALGHHAVALAICAALSKKTKVASLKHIEDALAEALPDRKIALATEIARALDVALKSRTDVAACEPWVADLVKVLDTHAGGIADGRLAGFLSKWERARKAAGRLANDRSLTDSLVATGKIPDHLFGFDLSTPPQCVADTLAELARAVPITVVSVNPVEQPPTCPAAKGWGDRSLHPVVPLPDVLRASKQTLPASPAGKPGSCLGVVQDLLRGRSTLPHVPIAGDHSLGIHVVDSKYRAAEIARDIVHRSIAEIPNLLLEDIVVVTDDPRHDAPYLDAAFAAVPAEKIDLTITALSTRDRDVAIDAFLTALQLGRSSFTAEHVFELIALPPVAEVLGLTPDEVEKLAEACGHVGLRAYIDEAHRKAAIGDFVGGDAGTWSAALDSLAASLAVPDGGHEIVTMSGTAPGGRLQSKEAHLLAALDRIITLLRHLNHLAVGGTPAAMSVPAKQLLTLLLPDHGGWSKSKRTIEAAIDAAEADASAAGYAGNVDFLWYRDDIARRIDRLGSGVLARYGGISVLTPAQARGRAARVAVVILSERFPTEDRPMWPAPLATRLPGDPRQWDADHRDFFSVFMHTTDHFAIVVSAVCARTRQPLPVSSIVHDARSAVHSALGRHARSVEHHESVTAHSLAARSGALPTRHMAAINGAKALHAMRCGSPRPQIFPSLDVATDVPRLIPLEEFVRFFEDPINAFLRHRGVYVKDVEESQAVRGLLEPTHLDRWKIRDRLFKVLLAAAGGQLPGHGQWIDDACRRFFREGLTHESRAGAAVVADQRAAVQQIVDTVRDARGAIGVLLIDIDVLYRVHGVDHTLAITGNVYFDGNKVVWPRLGTFTDKHAIGLVVLRAILVHAGVAQPCIAAALKSDSLDIKLLSDLPKCMVRNGVLPTLPHLSRLWHVGLQMPLPLFPDAIAGSFGPARQLHAHPYVPDAAVEFTKKDYGFGGGQGLDARVRAAFRGVDPLRSCQSGSTGTNTSDFFSIAEFLAGLAADAFPGNVI